MPQSLDKVLIHLIFSTKERQRFLDSSIRTDVHAFLAGIARKAGCECARVGGMDDHVHLAIQLSRTVAIAVLVEDLKSASSKWVKDKFPSVSQFAWQRGYGVFSTNPTDVSKLVEYIDKQEEHHRKVTFQDEYRRFLQKYDVAFDERYVWD